MKDTGFPIDNAEETRHSETYLRAVAAIEAEKRERERKSYALMMTAAAIGSGANGQGRLGRVTQLARNFCILFAFLTPSILLYLYVLRG